MDTSVGLLFLRHQEEKAAKMKEIDDIFEEEEEEDEEMEVDNQAEHEVEEDDGKCAVKICCEIVFPSMLVKGLIPLLFLFPFLSFPFLSFPSDVSILHAFY